MTIAGVVLAAGAGRRMGIPKALLPLPGGESYLVSACRVLRAGGCREVVAVLGARADEARAHLADLPGVHAIVNPAWAEGMGTSLRAGIAFLRRCSPASAAVIHVVDLPGVGPDVVRRLIEVGGTAEHVLARAVYDGAPGHPVLLGREHWAGAAAMAAGDQGAREYLRAHRPDLIEMSDLATGADLDTPAERRRFEAGHGGNAPSCSPSEP